jgi:signal transduction histidine kinase
MSTSRWSRVEPVDLVLALALTVATQAEIWIPGALGAGVVPDHHAYLSVTSLVITLPLILRRSHPWTVGLTALAAEAVQSFATSPEGFGNLLAMFLAMWSLGRYAPRPRGYLGIVPIVVASFVTGEDLADNFFVLLVLSAAWGAGVLVGRRTDDLDAMELRRLEATRAGAAEERDRIARELHDVVAHRVSMMVVQCQLADAVLDDDPARAREAIAAVTTAGRDALGELRAVLGLMHHDRAASLTPGMIDLSRLGDLVDEARRGGLPVTLETVGRERAVPPAVALAAFRIVQESMTNVVRHAGSAVTRVRLRYRQGAVELAVENDGPVLTGLNPGHGLAGMAERAAFLGGTLTAEPVSTGGLRVCTMLPIPGEES